MLTWALIVFAAAALGGLVMAAQHFGGRSPPSAAIAVIHGAAAATGLLLLCGAVFMQHAGGKAPVALGLFVLAALGGFTMALGFHARGKALPSPLVLGHAALAVIAFLILLGGALSLF